MIRLAAIAILVNAGLSGPAFSADAQGRYAVEGPGRMTCAALSALPKGDPGARDVAVWLSGYLSAHHRLAQDTFDLTPWQTPGTLIALMLQYCKGNPDQIVEMGAQHLVGYLSASRLTEESPTIAIQSGDKVTLIYAAVTERVIAALAERGIHVQGDGGELAAALKLFQGRNGLTETGLPDQPTLARLLGN